MERVCQISTLGSCKVGDNWKCYAKYGINRLLYMEGGQGGYILNGKRIPFKHGMLYFIPYYSGAPTYAVPGYMVDHTYADFTLYPPIISSNIVCIDPNFSPCIKNAVETYRSFCKKQALTDTETEFFKSLLMFLSETAIEFSPFGVITDKAIINALEIMHTSLQNKLTVADIAAKCYMSTDGFIRKFKRCTGETPYSYLKNIRIRTALTLKSQGVATEKIAEMCGYSDSSALLHAISSTKNELNLW